MYKKILVALDASKADQSLLPHIAKLAKIHHSTLLLVHIAEGWAARNYENLVLKESDEMKHDREYLDSQADTLRKEGIDVEILVGHGEPSEEILKIAEERQCDLIAMTSHGHRFFMDLFLGSAIEAVRHVSKIPLLIVHS